MSDETDLQEGIARAAESIVKSLADIAIGTSPAVALQASNLMVRLAISFVLNTLGPSVARHSLAAVARDLEVEIAALNGGGGAIN
jgi:hypothetical protein